MLTSGAVPPSGVKLSCAALTAPVDVPVVEAANSPEAAGPNRTSLPSMFPPAWPLPATCVMWTPSLSTAVLPWTSKPVASATDPDQSRNIAANTTHPCFWFPTIRPYA